MGEYAEDELASADAFDDRPDEAPRGKALTPAERAIEQRLVGQIDEERKRAHRIILDITLRRAELLNALEGIARTQVSCDHEFNPWILGGWWDKSDVRVCGKCGFTEHRRAPTVSAESPK